MRVKKVLILGAGGFLGSHLVAHQREYGAYVHGVDIKYPEFAKTKADKFTIGDLTEQKFCHKLFKEPYDEIYQLAADMGGAGYLFVHDKDADIMRHSAQININVLANAIKGNTKKIFYSSTACIYPKSNQADPKHPRCIESLAYPAEPDSEYGWEKLFSERLYLNHVRNYKLKVKIARLHGIFGPYGTWRGGREKALAAICRKVAEAHNGETIEIWGDGKQTRSFLYVDECVEGIRRLMASKFDGPVNIGSEEMVSINQLTKMTIELSGKKLKIKNVPGPQGVRGRNSDNTLIKQKLGWSPSGKLVQGLEKTYEWIEKQVLSAR